MNKGSIPVTVIEPERYELRESPFYHFEIDRRDFIKLMGGGVAVFLLLPKALAQESGRRGFGFNEPLPQNIGAWLHIGEVGAIQLVMGDTQLTPFDMGTFGSRTTPTMNKQLRRVAAVARNVLVELAAKRWNVSSADLVAVNGVVRERNGSRTVDYAELAQGQTLARAVVENEPLTPASEWTVAGTSVPKVNGRAFMTGEHRFPSDIRRPGMMFGKIVRPASYGATLTSLDDRKARAMPGVTVVREGDFVGVVAPSEFEAARAAAAIRAEWKSIPQPSNAELFDYLKSHAEQGRADYEAGSMKEGLASAAHRLSATYTIAYIQHAPLEPRAAVAEWQNDKLTVWTGSQRPFGVQEELEQAFHLTKDNCRVI